MQFVSGMFVAGSMVFSSVAPAAAQETVQQNDAVQAHIYSTIGFAQIKPELVLDGMGPAVAGSYTATQSEEQLDEIYRSGIYGITSGTVEGEFSGNTLTGYWYEIASNAGLQTACPKERNGTFIYGQFTLKFSADRKSFKGLRTSCDVVPNSVDHVYETWNGTLVRREAVAVANVAVAEGGEAR